MGKCMCWYTKYIL